MGKGFDPRTSFNKTDDTDVKYTGTSFPVLGITSGEKLSTVLEKVATILSAAAEVNNRVDQLEKATQLDATSLKANSLLFDLVDNSEIAVSALEDKTVNVEVKSASVPGRTDITFDFSDSLASLDSKYVPVGIETNIRTYRSNKMLGSSSSRSGVLTIENPTEPITITSRVNLRTKDGDMWMSKLFYLPEVTDQSLSGTFKVYGLSNKQAAEITQKQYNEVLASTISKLQKDVATLQKGLTSI